MSFIYYITTHLHTDNWDLSSASYPVKEEKVALSV